MKVLIVEEALKTLHGHWFQYIRDIVQGGQEAGHEIEVAVHKDACPEIRNALPCQPILRSSVFDPSQKTKGIKRVIAHNFFLYLDLSKFFSAGNSYDVVIAPTVRLDHLLAYAGLALRFQNRRFSKLVLIMIDSVGQYSADYSQIYFSSKSLPLKWSLKLFGWLMKKKSIHLVAESAGHARQFEAFCGIKFPTVPHVTVLPPLEQFQSKKTKSSNELPVLGTFGFTRFDKGLDVLQEAIKILLQSDGQIQMRFVLQWTGDYRLPDGSLVCKNSVLQQCPLVQYIPAFNRSDEYYEWIARTDIMVLPYRKDFYHDKLSRVAIDAALAGMPLVYPIGTWLEGFVNEHAAGVAFEPENPASLATAIQQAVRKFPELKTRAEQRKQPTSGDFSARNFFEIIAGLPGSTANAR